MCTIDGPHLYIATRCFVNQNLPNLSNNAWTSLKFDQHDYCKWIPVWIVTALQITLNLTTGIVKQQMSFQLKALQFLTNSGRLRYLKNQWKTGVSLLHPYNNSRNSNDVNVWTEKWIIARIIVWYNQAFMWKLLFFHQLFRVQNWV